MGELDEARKLFERAEKESVPGDKLALLQEALDLVEDYLADHMPSDHEYKYGINLRHSYLRTLLVQLAGMRKIEIGDWIHYIQLFFFRCESDVTSILAEDPALKDSYKSFLDVYRKDVIRLLERAQ